MSNEYNAYTDPPSPELVVHVGELALVLTWDNTDLYFYRPPWEGLDHIQVAHDRLPHEGRLFKGIPGIKYTLVHCLRLDYPYRFATRPSEEIVDAYVAWQNEELGVELEEGL